MGEAPAATKDRRRRQITVSPDPKGRRCVRGVAGNAGHGMPRRGGDGSSADVLEELLGPFPVVRLRGLPFEAQVSDIISFFQVRHHASGRYFEDARA